VECKCKGDRIDPDQICRHGNRWLVADKKNNDWHKRNWDDIARKDLLDLTWYNVLEAIEATKSRFDKEEDDSAQPTGRGNLERKILDELAVFIGFYDYQLFTGFDLNKPWPARILELPDNKERKTMTDGLANANFLSVFERLQRF
jgi:hypothetical protein